MSLLSKKKQCVFMICNHFTFKVQNTIQGTGIPDSIILFYTLNQKRNKKHFILIKSCAFQ